MLTKEISEDVFKESFKTEDRSITIGDFNKKLMITSESTFLVKLGYSCLESDLKPINKEIDIKTELHKYSKGYLFNSVKSNNSFISSHRVIVAYSRDLSQKINKVISERLNKHLGDHFKFNKIL